MALGLSREPTRGTLPTMKPFELFPAPLRRTAPRARALARRVADVFPLTGLGMAFSAVAAVALVSFGFEKLDLVLLVVGYGGAALLVIAVLGVSLSALLLKFGLVRASHSWRTSTLETGAPLPTGFSVPSFWWFPLVQVRWSWVSPDGATIEPVSERGRRTERVTLTHRGIFAGVTRRILVQDAFGLARIAFRHRQEEPIEVLPHLGGIRRLPVLTSLTGGEEYPHPMGLEDGDRVELRRYVPGDSARFIHWKVFGRTRKLMVRVPERALSRSRRTVAYLVAGEGDEAAAAAARAAIQEDALGMSWQFAADGAPEATSDPHEAVHKILDSAGFEGRSGSGLKRFLAEVDPGGPAALVVFAPPALGHWLEEMRALSARRYGRIRVVIAVDAVLEGAEAPSWRRWFLTPQQAYGVPRAELERVGRALSQLRCEVVIIDRVSGRVLGDGVRLNLPQRRAA